METDFKRTINWKKDELNVTVEQRNQCFDFLINLSSQGVNTLFVLWFQNNNGSTSYTRYYLPLVEIKDYNIMIDGQNFFDQPIKNDLITCENIQNITTGQGDDYTTGYLLDYTYFKSCHTTITVNLSKQQALDADLKAIQQINVAANLGWDGNTTMFFIIEEEKEAILDFSQALLKYYKCVPQFYFVLI